MEYGISYIARDRGRAMAAQRSLPDHATGAVLSADIAGFTPLTALLSSHLGPQRGAEELTHILNQVYTALIAVVDQAGGSVIGFSGDAITCWFDADDGVAASACGLALQTAMRPFGATSLPTGLTVSLRLKVAIAAGAVRRFLVGDPAIQYLDVIAGDTLERLADVEALARPDEVALEAATAIKLGDQLGLRWVNAAGEQRYAVIEQAIAPPVAGVAALPWPALTQAQVQPWMLPAVARFHDADQALFTELRPAVALFMAFDGLDYTHSAGAGPLNHLICHVQRVIAQYEGTVLQVTVGDKGSYLYAAFGAPTMHEDDAVRAVHAASALRALALDDFGLAGVRFGLSQGIMRVGVYGSAIRRTYGVLGDAANVAARLMQRCPPGQVLASSELHALAPMFAWQPLGPLQLKGKATPLEVVSLGSQGQPASLPPGAVTLPMIGREREFARLTAAVSDVGGGAGKLVGITGEAGIGKSRLVAELLALLGERGWIVAQGECQSYATNTPYMVWHDIWRSLFGLDRHQSSADQIHTLERRFAAISPDLLERIPLLGPVVNLSIADNDLTRALPAKLQRESREALLIDYLRAQAASLGGSGRGIALVLEDCHWVDPLSRELLLTLARIVPNLPILIVATYRPAADPDSAHPPVLGVAGAEEYGLAELDQRDIERFLSAKLAQVTGQIARAIPAAVVAHVATRTNGNPFYIGELVQYLVTLGLDPSDLAVWSNEALPDSLQRLILSRIDQLTTYQQRTIKLSSVLGRLVRAQWLHGAYPALGQDTQVYQALAALHQRDLLLPTGPQEDVEYLFKHVITQDVTYHSLTHATRLALHEQFGQYLERIAGDEAWAVDLLAYHYGQTENLAKKRLYLGRAGDAARASYANAAAVSYYRRLLPLLEDPIERCAVLQSLGEVLDVTSEWSAAIEVYQEALELAISSDQLALRLHAQHMLGMLYRKQGTYPEALASLSAVQAECVHHNDTAKLMAVILEICHMYIQQGNYDQARELIEPQLVLAKELGNQHTQAISFDLLGLINYYQGKLDLALHYLDQSLALHRQRGDVVMEAVLLSELGAAYYVRGEYASAQEYLLESLHIQQRVGHNQGIMRAATNLISVSMALLDYETALNRCSEYVNLCRLSGDRRMEITNGIQLGRITLLMHNYPLSREYNERYLTQAHNVGDPTLITHAITNFASLEFEEGHYEQAWELLKDCLNRALGIGYQLMIGYALVKAAAVAGQVAARSADGLRRFYPAIQLLSAGSALLASRTIALDVYEQGLSDTLVAAAQAQLGSAEYTAAWESGQLLAADLDLAAVIALAEPAILSE
jgi:class 3 adenylate cyclase/tetratricopeptide (TPR) repeat protein